MKKTPNKSGFYIKTAIVLLIVLLGYFFIPMGQNNSFNNAAKIRGTATTGEPIKLQFRNGFQYDKYEPSKKTTFMQKRLQDDDKEKKPIFWDKK